ncbi:hypothetical protein [Chryseobacterium aureum]|uniref:hypothetical protein n=1 Tax=Chryseobacterium aureum TaxID=2497456 RepID=UPI000F8887DB|nr:hypothetical protein [Chryseobacterium aureum]
MEKNFLHSFNNKKVKINWNKNPVKMDLFFSFLTVDLKENTDTLGYCNGWREYRNEEYELIVKGGIVSGYGLLLDTLQYRKNLDNKYNNYVNPFYLFDIMTNEGKKFFINYYSDDIRQYFEEKKDLIENLQLRIIKQKDELEFSQTLMKHFEDEN